MDSAWHIVGTQFCFFFFPIKEGREGSQDVEGEVARSRDVEMIKKRSLFPQSRFDNDSSLN